MKYLITIIFILFFISCDTTEKNSNVCSGFECPTNEICAITNDNEAICIDDGRDKCENIDCNENSHCKDGVCLCDEGYQLENDNCILESSDNKFKLRVLASNLTSGNYQTYEEEGINILKALKADIILVQEFNYDGEISNFVKTTFGDEFTYFRGTPTGNGDIPNGVISRYPIIDKGEWKDERVNDRLIDWVIIETPAKKIFAVSVHLKAKENKYQIKAAELISKKIYNHRVAHPNEYFYIVGGDFNGAASLCRDNSCNGFKKYNNENIFYTALPDPYSEYNRGTTTNATKTRQLDFILVDYSLKDFQISTDYCKTEDDCKSYPSGLVFRSDEYSQSDLDRYFSPVQTNDSEVMQMQHMGVVKDFLITY